MHRTYENRSVVVSRAQLDPWTSLTEQKREKNHTGWQVGRARRLPSHGVKMNVTGPFCSLAEK